LNETEIYYIDPETEEEEPMELGDLEPGFTMLIRYDIGEEDSYLARIIEIRSLGLGYSRVSWIDEPFKPEPPVRVAGVHLRPNEAMLFSPPEERAPGRVMTSLFFGR
jgi:hypothetical protein